MTSVFDISIIYFISILYPFLTHSNIYGLDFNMARGRIINSTKTEDILSVYKYFQRENQKQSSVKKKTDHQIVMATLK